MKVVSDTGPLIALAKLDLLPLFARLFGEVCIPPAVQSELFAKRGPEAPRLEEALRGGIYVVAEFTLPEAVERLTHGLGAGEQHAIGLARHLQTTLIIDERSGRFAAKQLGVDIIGTVGILLQAKQGGLIESVGVALDQIRRGGYWISDSLVEEATNLAGE